MSVREKVARNTKFMAAGRLWEAVSSLVLTRYIVERVGVESFGVWAFIAVFVGYVALFDFGIGSAYVKYIAEHAARKERENISAVVSTGFFFYLAMGAVILAVGWPCVHWIVSLLRSMGVLAIQESPELVFLLRGGLALFVATNVMSSFTSVQTGMQRMGITTALSFVASLVKITATVAFLEMGLGLRGLLFSNALSFALFAAVSFVIAFRLVPGLRFSPRMVEWSTFHRLFGFGLRAQVSRLSNLIMFETDKAVAMFVFRQFGLVGLYEIGVAMANKMRQVPVLLLSALVPAASELDAREEHDRLRRLYLVSTKYVAAVTFPLSLYTIACAGPIIRTWMGDRPGIETSIWVLRIIALGYIGNIISGAGVSVLLGKGRADLQMKAGLICSGANIALTIALVYTVGFWGIPIATTLSIFIGWFWFMRAARPAIGISVGETVRACLLWPAVASVPGGLLCGVCDALTTGLVGFVVNAAVLLGTSLAFGLLYLAAIRKTPFLDEFDLDFMENTLGMGRVPGFRAWTRGMRHV